MNHFLFLLLQISMDKLSELLTSNCKRIQEEKKWSSIPRIIGEAIEDCVCSLECPLCNTRELVKYKANQKSKDLECQNCKCQIQVKAKATKRNTKTQTKLTLLGAEYKSTCLSIKENKVHYLIVLYSVTGTTYKVVQMYFVHSENINQDCIIPRKPLSSTARRAGWQGCTLVFTTFIPISPNH